jgi:hypothetical protein
MHTFAQKPKAVPQVMSAKSRITGRGRFGQSPKVGSILHLQGVFGNRLVQRMIETTMEDGNAASTTPGISRLDQDSDKISVVPPNRAASPASNDNNWGIRSIIRHLRHHFSAAIRRVGPAFQHDPMSANVREPAIVFGTQPTQTPIAPPHRSIPEPEEGGTVHFPADELQSITLPEQSDKIASNFGYKSSITQKDPPPGPGEFGTTRPFYAFEKPGPSAIQNAGTFNVTGTIAADITFQVAGPNRTDIASDAAPDITQQNYPTVVSDLTPSPAAVNSGGLSLYKNQPPRTKFWAEDLTIKHECFHADEDVKFGRQGVALAQDWLDKQTARTYDEVGVLLNKVTPIIARKVDTEMALPGRELRAYADGAPDYRARAQAIKRKGDAKGYVPKPPAIRTPSSPPAATPKAPSQPPAPARNEPAPK